MRKKQGVWKRVLLVLVCLGIAGGGLVLGINTYIKKTAETRIITQEAAAALANVDCILVLGCGVREDGSPSHMLEDRLKQGVVLYDLEASPKLLMSGDHGRVDYNEVGTMKQYALNAEIPSEDVFMDHAGFSTYETMYRAKEIFGAQNVVIVTQEYHLYRAIYIAEELGMEAHGVSADLRTYRGQLKRDVREVLARCKDFAMCLFKPEPTYLGEAIPVSGNGDLTNDQ